MPEKASLSLTDKEIYPTDDLIFSVIGNKKIFWKDIIDHMINNYKDSMGQWNYYNDGERWLFKMTLKKKTIFWAGILSDTFRITFYLGNKAESVIAESDLPQIIKNEFMEAKRYGQIRPVTIIISNQIDVDNVFKMIAIKTKLK